jgi:hypothetical protein
MEERIQRVFKDNEACQRIAAVEGIGPLTAHENRRDVCLRAVSVKRALGVRAFGYRSQQLSLRTKGGSKHELREALIAIARQKPRYGYRRLHALMVRREPPSKTRRSSSIRAWKGMCGVRSTCARGRRSTKLRSGN